MTNHTTPEPASSLAMDRPPINCTECGDTGYLLDQGYGNADIPEDWTPVQACDQHTNGRLTDEEAAMRAADDRDDIDHRVHYAFFPGGLDDDEPLPGDWAIGPNQ